MQHFKSEADALAYIKAELLATLRDDLDRQEGSEAQHYSDSDRQEMRNRIADLESIMPRLILKIHKYKPGDIISDKRKNWIEILEVRGGFYIGHQPRRRSGMVNFEGAIDLIDSYPLEVETLQQRIDRVKERFNRLTGAGENAEHIAAIIERLEAMR